MSQSLNSVHSGGTLVHWLETTELRPYLRGPKPRSSPQNYLIPSAEAAEAAEDRQMGNVSAEEVKTAAGGAAEDVPGATHPKWGHPVALGYPPA